jgi:hypothetical protein
MVFIGVGLTLWFGGGVFLGQNVPLIQLEHAAVPTKHPIDPAIHPEHATQHAPAVSAVLLYIRGVGDRDIICVFGGDDI